jgi:hypothetical protein
MFLNPDESVAFDRLGELLGMTSPRDVVILAIREALARRGET